VEESDLAIRLRASLARQEEQLRSSLILNPVENVPFDEDIAVASNTLHGLYNSDKERSREQRLSTPIQFAGRQDLERDSRAIYAAWADALGAADVTLRVLSGLHAHIVLFMALARPGQRVLLLPIEGGGHLAGKAIQERLGLEVVEMAIDSERMCVDIPATLKRCEENPPDFVFVDRSEGLVFEDLSSLARVAAQRSVFDGSQYLSNILAGDHPNPFQDGYDLFVASVHKNFPGPQKALIATGQEDETWRGVLSGVSTYVSNLHVASIYAAGLTLSRSEWLHDYSRRMLDVAVALEAALDELGVPVVRRATHLPPTHHIWIQEGEPNEAFQTYEQLEACRIMTNYRQLPYSLGHGIRLGVSAAVRVGLEEADVSVLAELIAAIRERGATPELEQRARSFNREIWQRPSLSQATVPQPESAPELA
jgi:glycine hydroxymethyltransferase